MAHLILPSKRLVQPYGAADIDQSAPLSRGLVGYINPAAKNFQAVGAAAFKQTSGGLALLGTGSSLAFKNVPAFTNAATILFVGNWLTGGQHVVSIGTSGAGDQCFILQAGQTGSSQPRALIRTVQGGGVTTAEAFGSGNDTEYPNIEVWCARYDGTTNLRLFRNGLDYTDSNKNTGASGAMSSLDNVGLGGTNRGSDAFAKSGQTGVLGLYWSRALSPAEIKEISRNPWQVFRPVQRRIYFDVGAGGGATTSVSTDLTGEYAIRSAVQSDVAANYAIRAAVQSDRAGTYAIRTSASADLSAGYDILNATAVSSDMPASYLIRSAVQADALAEYAVRGSVAANSPHAFMVRGLVSSDASASYAVEGARYPVSRDLSASYTIEVAGGYPMPDDVRKGVQYGPNGNDYTGTLAGGKGTVMLRRR